MPTYCYCCKSCGHDFEIEQRITADPLKECPECKQEELKKVIQPSGFQQKGNGWYNKGKY